MSADARPSDFTPAEKYRELRREIGQRENVYPRLIAAGKLTRAKADRQLAIMREVAADYLAQLGPDLFGGAGR